ncbi:MAG: sortase [Actinomycetota bacterium]|nr:sortase [Actinomycetota bacterium]
MRKTVAGIGRTLVTLGLLILLFVGYQLWGTDVFTARAQTKLDHQFASLLGKVRSETTTTAPSTTSSTLKVPVPTTTTTTAPAPLQLPPINAGDPLGRITIPAAGVNWIFVQGTERDDLAKGPGHYPSTPLPGQVGNSAIAGHRTTHGAPFYNIDRLRARTLTQPGDYIVTESLVGTHVFEVIEQRIVKPTDTWVAGPMSLPAQQLNRVSLKLSPNRSYLTLTSCNPRYSARERIVILAELIDNRNKPKGIPHTDRAVGIVKFKGQSTTENATALRDGLSGDISSRIPALLTGILALLVGMLWWWAFRRYRHPITWFTGVVPFLMVLFVFYVYLERMLPAGY